MKKVLLLLFLIVGFSVIIRAYNLERLPGEWFGDISNVHEYEMQVINGQWPFYFFQSPGPLYHYLIAPIVILYKDHGYVTYKVASVIISLIGLMGIYLFTKEITNKKTALMTVLTASFSLWFLIWSRLGNSQIVIPAISSFMAYFLVRYIKRNHLPDLLLGAFVASLGWYTYPQTFLFPIVYLLIIVVSLAAFYILGKSRINPLRTLLHFILVTFVLVILTIPFVQIVKNQPGNFGPQGYVGKKVLLGGSLISAETIEKLKTNLIKTVRMLHIRGDETFRVNVSGHPQIDKISGMLFFLGIIYFFRTKKYLWLFFTLFFLFVLILPSILPAIPKGEIPSSSRTIAVIPFVFVLVGAGLSEVYFWVKKILPKKYLTEVLVTGLFVYLVFANLRLYFVDYTKGLPDKNLGPGRIIAAYIDKLPSNYSVNFSSCCWGEAGQPEHKGVVYNLTKERQLFDWNRLIKSCQEVGHYPAVVVVGPDRYSDTEIFEKCALGTKVDSIYSEDGRLVSYIVNIPSD